MRTAPTQANDPAPLGGVRYYKNSASSPSLPSCPSSLSAASIAYATIIAQRHAKTAEHKKKSDYLDCNPCDLIDAVPCDCSI